MKWLGSAITCLLVVGCASAGAREARRAYEARTVLWGQAHEALNALQFARADTLFGTLIREYGATETGRESLFYVAAVRLDPRNPAWSSELAESALELYLAGDTGGVCKIHRPEARTMYEIARQLNLPTEARVPGLQAETRVVTQRVVVPAREATSLQAEVSRLRDQLAARDNTIRRQEEELDRIRKTLSAPRE